MSILVHSTQMYTYIYKNEAMLGRCFGTWSHPLNMYIGCIGQDRLGYTVVTTPVSRSQVTNGSFLLIQLVHHGLAVGARGGQSGTRARWRGYHHKRQLLCHREQVFLQDHTSVIEHWARK